MSSKAGRHVASWGRRQSDRTKEAGRGAGGGWLTGRRPLATRAVAVLAIAALVLPPCAIRPAQAQRLISISAAKRTASIMIAVGKTDSVAVHEIA